MKPRVGRFAGGSVVVAVTTRATFDGSGPKIEYEAVDIQYIEPRARVYDVDKKESGA